MKKDELFANAFELAPVGMALVSPKGEWLDVNESLCNAIGYAKEELLKVDFQRLTHPDDLHKDLKMFEECLKGLRKSYQMEKRYFHKNGSIVWVLLVVSIIKTKTGDPDFFIAQIQDLTEIKRNQEAVIQNSKLAALGEMAAGIAHEINNPLTIIRGNADHLNRLIENSSFGEENTDTNDKIQASEHIKKINQTVHRISSIVKGMRTFAKDGKKEKFSNVSLSEVFADILGVCSQKLKNENIELTVDIDPELSVKGKAVNLGQVFLNLLTNASYAVRDQEDKRIVVKAFNNGSTVKVTVEDSGAGISPEIQDKIMQPFFSTKPPSQGTGLGLSISKAMVEMMNGNLTYLNHEKNTTFLVELPAFKAHLKKSA